MKALFDIAELDADEGTACGECPYAATCRCPAMEPYGHYGLKILIVGEAPGSEEDQMGRGFVGMSGKVLQKDITSAGGNFDHDTSRTNVMRCRPPNNKFPALSKIVPCVNWLKQYVRDIKPTIIISVGGKPYDVLCPQHKQVTAANLLNVRGHIIPLPEYNTFLMPVLHPSYIAQYADEVHYKFLAGDLRRAWDFARQPSRPEPYTERDLYLVSDIEDAEHWLKQFSQADDTVVFDYEMTGLDVEKDQIISVSLDSLKHQKNLSLIFLDKWWRSPDSVLRLRRAWMKWLASPCNKVVADINTEVLWSWFHFGIVPQNIIEDITVSSHVVDQRRGCNRLEWRTFVYFGQVYKQMVNKKSMGQENLLTVAQYGSQDSYNTQMVRQHNLFLSKKQKQDTAYELMQQAAYAYSKMSCRGIKIDQRKMEQIESVGYNSKEEKENELYSMPCVSEYTRKHGMEYESTQDARTRVILYDILGEERVSFTGTGLAKVDKDTLDAVCQQTDSEDTKRFISALTAVSDANKLLADIRNIKKNTWADGRIHPRFKMNLVTTYRSSCVEPNLQNQQKHGGGKAIREAFVSTLDYVGEADYKGMEARLIAFISQDPTLLRQLNDETFDIHIYWGERLFSCIPKKRWPVDFKDRAKSGFVFPTFYGSWHKMTALNMGLPVDHVRQIEYEFWSMYGRVREHNERTEGFYKQHGYITLFNGYKVPGPLYKNKIVNYIYQGPASHYLAASVIDVTAELEERNMKSFLCGQIHDSMMPDYDKSEVHEAMSIIDTCMKKKRWGIERAPLLVDFSIGRNWLEQKEL